MTGANSAKPHETAMIEATEWLVSINPLVVRRRVLWGECDPAGVVYTPRFADYAASARDYWFRYVLGHLDRPHPDHKQIVFPMRAMSFDFAAMLAADDVFDMTVSLLEMRTRTFTIEVVATKSDGTTAFSARLTQIAFDQALTRAVELPQPLRGRLETLV